MRYSSRESEPNFAGIETAIVLIVGIAGILLAISAFRLVSPLDFLGRIIIGGLCAGFCVWHMRNVMKRR